MTDIRRRLRAALFLSMFASLPAWADDVSARWLTQVTADACADTYRWQSTNPNGFAG